MKKIKRKFQLIARYPGNNSVGSVYTETGVDVDGEPTINCLGKTVSPTKYPTFFGEVDQALFTTVDGMDIYEGEGYWYVTDNLTKVIGAIADSGFDYAGRTKHRFSTPDLAQEYIDQHQPKYSLADVEQAIHEGLHVNLNERRYTNYILEKLKKNGTKH